MSWPLSVKHAADKNNFIGISSFLAWGKSRVGLPPPFIAMGYLTFLGSPTFMKKALKEFKFEILHVAFHDYNSIMRFWFEVEILQSLHHSFRIHS